MLSPAVVELIFQSQTRLITGGDAAIAAPIENAANRPHNKNARRFNESLLGSSERPIRSTTTQASIKEGVASLIRQVVACTTLEESSHE
jgi:hypothetical protein